MKYVDCRTQAELDAALKLPDTIPNLIGDGEFEISGSSQVTAYGSSQVTAYGSSQVTASESSQVRAYGSSQVTASKYVAVTKTGNAVKAVGGVQIDFVPPQELSEWFDEYNVVPKDGVVILYKAVDSDFMSPRKGNYSPGSTPKSDKWDDGGEECGSGLHFCGTPFHALGFYPDAKRFVGCPVKVESIAMHVGGQYPQKIKAPEVVAPGCFEVDINGKPVK